MDTILEELEEAVSSPPAEEEKKAETMMIGEEQGEEQVVEMKRPRGRPKGSGTKGTAVIFKRKYTEEMAAERMRARNAADFKNSKAEVNEINYLLSLLEAFDKRVRQTVPNKWNTQVRVHGNFKYKPYQLYETMLAYFHIAISNGRNISLSHLAWFCGYSASRFRVMIEDEDLSPHYRFIKDFVTFLEGLMEYEAQEKQNPAFHIFWLKNRGWKDKFEISASATPGALTEEQRLEAQKRIADFSEKKFLPSS